MSSLAYLTVGAVVIDLAVVLAGGNAVVAKTVPVVGVLLAGAAGGGVSHFISFLCDEINLPRTSDIRKSRDVV